MTYGIGMGTAEPHSARGQAAHEILRLTGAPKWATCDELSTKPNGSRDQAVLQLKEIIAESNYPDLPHCLSARIVFYRVRDTVAFKSYIR